MSKTLPKKKKKKAAKKKKVGRPLDKTWHKGFIISLEQHGVVAVACRKSKVPRNTAVSHYKKYPRFKNQWDEAIIASTELLEGEAIRRAHGERDSKGIHRHSDVLLIFLLKARKPEKYRDNYSDDMAPAGPVTILLQNAPRINRRKEDVKPAV